MKRIPFDRFSDKRFYYANAPPCKQGFSLTTDFTWRILLCTMKYLTRLQIYCKETFNGAQSVINYLGKYTHRIAISNHRIKSMTEATVTYAVKDYKNKGQWKEKTVPGEEFIRRFLMHVPPKRFVRIRHYGLLSCRNKSKKMTHCRNLLGCKKYISALKNRSAAEMIKLLYNIDVCRCSSCGGKMVPHLPDKHTPSVLVHMRC